MIISQVPHTNMGTVIVAAVPDLTDARRTGFVVTALLRKTAQQQTEDRYVTWRFDGMFSAGHYDMPLGEALRDMVERAGLVPEVAK